MSTQLPKKNLYFFFIILLFVCFFLILLSTIDFSNYSWRFISSSCVLGSIKPNIRDDYKTTRVLPSSFVTMSFVPSGVPQEGFSAVLQGKHWLLLSHWRHLHWMTPLRHPRDVLNTHSVLVRWVIHHELIYICWSACMVHFFSSLHPATQWTFPSFGRSQYKYLHEWKSSHEMFYTVREKM